jgi:hypothetical protein
MLTPPAMNRNLRPYRSTTNVDTTTAKSQTVLMMTEPNSALPLLNPTVRNSTGGKMKMRMKPVKSKKAGMATMITA